jgi:hypothetical protein
MESKKSSSNFEIPKKEGNEKKNSMSSLPTNILVINNF